MITEQDILQREKKEITRLVHHKDKSKTPTPYQHIGYISEDKMLSDFMIWANNNRPKTRGFIFHIKNEGHNASKDGGSIQGAIDLAKGVMSGVPDVLSVYGGRFIFIEFKLPNGTLSEEQRKLHLLWGSVGIKIYIVKTFSDWKNIIDNIILIK